MKRNRKSHPAPLLSPSKMHQVSQAPPLSLCSRAGIRHLDFLPALVFLLGLALRALRARGSLLVLLLVFFIGILLGSVGDKLLKHTLCIVIGITNSLRKISIQPSHDVLQILTF